MKRVKDVSKRFQGQAVLYKLPCKLRSRDVGIDDDFEFEYVVVSAVHAMFTGDETMVFAADEDGKVLSWLDLIVIRYWDVEDAASLFAEEYLQNCRKDD